MHTVLLSVNLAHSVCIWSLVGGNLHVHYCIIIIDLVTEIIQSSYNKKQLLNAQLTKPLLLSSCYLLYFKTSLLQIIPYSSEVGSLVN